MAPPVNSRSEAISWVKVAGQSSELEAQMGDQTLTRSMSASCSMRSARVNGTWTSMGGAGAGSDDSMFCYVRAGSRAVVVLGRQLVEERES